MAKTQIGAVIGIEGAKEYNRDIANIVRVTKEMESEIKATESAFKSEYKTVQDVRNLKEKLQTAIGGYTQKLSLQKDAQKEMNTQLDIEERRSRLLPERIERLTRAGDEYKESLEAVKKEYAENQEKIERLTTSTVNMETAINQTQTELNNLNNRMDELPADNFTGKLKLIKENIEKNDSALKFWADTLTGIGNKMTMAFTVPIVGGFTASVKAATDWESSLNGVRKTTDMDKDSLNQLATELKEQALTTTYSSNELANLAQIAGQLGVRGVNELSNFVGIVSDLGIATDLSAEDAATALARIFNITEGGVRSDNLDKLSKIGDVIVHLGNNMATTEPEIVAMANRMASAGHSAGLATTDVFALSAALTSVGITAEAGGSTVGQVLKTIQKDVAEWSSTGEGDMLRLADISGMSAEKFAETWRNEPIKAFEAFVTGLGNLKEGDDDLVLILDDLDMAGIRQSNMLQALAAAQEEGTDTTQLFTRALELTDQAYKGVNEDGETFSALQQEANVRKEESKTSFENLAEAVNQLGQAFGEVLLPVVIPIVEGLTNMITAFANMDQPTKTLIVTLLGLLAAAGPLLTTVGTGLTLFNNLSIAATTLGTTTSALLLGMGKWVLIGAAVVLAISGIVAAINWLRDHSEQIVAFWQGASEGFQMIWEVVKFAFEEGVNLIGEKFNQFKAWVEELRNKVDNGFRNMVQGVKDKLNNMKTAVENVRNRIDETFRNLVSNAWNWGKDLIGNMVSGIMSKVGNLISSVKNVASTIWSYLHFSEPEKGKLADFNTWMPDMMMGLAKGINDNLYLVDRAAENVANSLGMGGTSYNYGGVVINLNVPQGANGYQMVDEIENALAQRTMRRKAVFN